MSPYDQDNSVDGA